MAGDDLDDGANAFRSYGRLVPRRFAPRDLSHRDVSPLMALLSVICHNLLYYLYYYNIHIFLTVQFVSCKHKITLHVVLHGRKIYFQINPIQLWLNSLGSILLNAYIIYLLIKNANQECNLIDILDRQIFWFYLCLTYTFIS